MAKWFPCLWFDGNAEEAAELLRDAAAGQPRRQDLALAG